MVQDGEVAGGGGVLDYSSRISRVWSPPLGDRGGGERERKREGGDR